MSKANIEGLSTDAVTFSESYFYCCIIYGIDPTDGPVLLCIAVLLQNISQEHENIVRILD